MKADPKESVAGAAKPSAKKLIVVAAVVVLALSASGAAAWHFLKGDGEPDGTPKKVEKSTEPPVYVPLDQFVVNLQPEDDGEHYLQLKVTLQVPTPEQVELIKANMPVVQNRVLLLLSAKRASELSTPEGKRQLSTELSAAINQPFVEKGDRQEISDVLFTNFIIQ